MPKRMMTVLAVIGALAWGCAVQSPKEWYAAPATRELARSAYDIALQPVKSQKQFFTAFQLMVKNKGPAPLEIDWRKTRYLAGGRANGGFMFAGLSPKMLNTPPADTIAPGGTLTKEIWPVRLIAYAPYRDKSVAAGRRGFSRGVMPAGENGIALVLRQGSRLRREVLTVTISTR